MSDPNWKVCPRCFGVGRYFDNSYSTVEVTCMLCNGAGGLTRYPVVRDWPIKAKVKDNE